MSKSCCGDKNKKNEASCSSNHDGHDHIHNGHDRKNTIRLFLVLGLSVVALVALVLFHGSLNMMYQYIIFFPFYLILGLPVFKYAIKDFISGHFMRESFLMSIATLGAIFIGELPEALAVLVFYRFGNYFEELGEVKSRSAIESLMKTKADYANKVIDIKNNAIEKVAVEIINEEDIIIINPSEKVPVDCIIIDGGSSVDTRALTGESMPRYVEIGDSLLATMINMEGTLYARVLKKYSESSISRILKLVEEASSRKTNLEKFISRFAGIYTPIIVGISVLLTAIPVLIFKQDFNTYLMRSLTLLVISCPCAFVVGIPLTYFSSIGGFAKKGIIFKGGVFIDIAAKIKTVIFDKTGTLTTGIFMVKGIHAIEIEESLLVKYAALAENSSHHPIAKSIVSYYKERYGSVDTALIKGYKEISARGATAIIDGKNVLVGNKKLLVENNVILTEDNNVDAYAGIVYVAIDNIYKGTILIADTIKSDTIKALKNLRDMNIHTVLLSGDKKDIVEKFAKDVGLDEAKSELLPEDKLTCLESIMKEYGTTSFVGDGINDAPSLARSDVGIAMGALSTDAATENADVVIMDDNPKKVIDIIRGARLTKSVVTQNMLFAFLIKLVVLVLSILGITSMWAGVFSDTGVTVIVILNALRLLYFKDAKV